MYRGFREGVNAAALGTALHKGAYAHRLISVLGRRPHLFHMPFRPVIAALTLALGAIAIAAACGGGGEALTLEDYFQRLDVLVDSVAESSQSLGEDAFAELGPSSSIEEMSAATRAFVTAFGTVADDFRESLSDLDPPPPVEAAHEAFLVATTDFADSTDAVLNELDDADSVFDIEGLFESDIFLAKAGERIEQACFAVQKIADENSIAVSLNCALE